MRSKGSCSWDTERNYMLTLRCRSDRFRATGLGGWYPPAPKPGYIPTWRKSGGSQSQMSTGRSMRSVTASAMECDPRRASTTVRLSLQSQFGVG